jgi:glycogen operon protein
MRRIGPGSPEPLGLTLVADGANVAVCSAHATSIELCLFDAAGEREVARIALPERTGDVHHGFVAGVVPGARYGLRAHGPYAPQHGHRFNPAKLLVDPYATRLDRRFSLHPSMFGEHPDGVTRNDVDSAPFMPKGVAETPTPIVADTRPRVPWSDTILYELHLRGYTIRHPAVPEALRGTGAGLAHPAAIDHLVRLGVTTVELMPIAAAIDERHLAALNLTNYWGYNPVAFRALDPRLFPGGSEELRACIAALHEAGIEIVLDIVLNHTGEGDELGPTLSLRGLDNATYFRTPAGAGGRYINDSGCGNTLALDRPPVVRLAMDTLRHYAALGVDGFRFDLATAMARREDGFDPAAPLLQAIAQDPLLRELKMIAEPWDIGHGGYRLGAFPPGWGEWNDRYRDTLRRYWRGERGMVADLATRLAGSADVLAPRARPPSRSINFLTAHDGFTLADLVAYERKHNDANGEDNRDGTDANHSWNNGAEGATDDTAIRAARARDVRSLLASLLLARGTPMLAMGDEMGRTQHGNNNAYAHDDPLTWLDWANADTALQEFTSALIALRRAHPALRADRWLTGAPADDKAIADVEWRRPDGVAMQDADWNDATRTALVAALYAPASAATPADRVAIAYNASRDAVEVTWPRARPGFTWCTVVDTSQPTGRRDAHAGTHTTLAARSVVACVEMPDSDPRVRRAGIDADALAQLAKAAGIALDWWDVSGERHVVPAETIHALLAAMGQRADSTADVRARLAALSDAREMRALPAVAVAAPHMRTTIALCAAHLPAGARLRLHLIAEDDSSDTPLDVRAGDLPERMIDAPDGRHVAQRVLELPALAPGCYTLRIGDDAGSECRVVVAPPRCFFPPELREGARRFGLAAHLYALRRGGDQGIGDFTTLAQAAAATAARGGVTVGINPLHALFPGDRERASPYQPSDRRFLDPIYIDITAVPDFAASAAARGTMNTHAAAIAALAARTHVDYTGVWEAKRAVLDACFEHFEARRASDPQVKDFERFVAAGGDALQAFALFDAIADVHPGSCTRWPTELAGPRAAGVRAFAAAHARRIRYACYLQWLADRQLAAAASDAHDGGLGLGFYRDLAIGAAPDGAEVWSDAHGIFARGVSIGAPPDPFARAGQVWGLPPPVPYAMRASGYRGFRALLAANMRHAGALRIDHVMGLMRLFWVPEGAPARDGAYIDYPRDDLLAVLALESARARCMIVGEDLGTVPSGLRERLDDADVLSYRLLWFERHGIAFAPPAHYPRKATACASTHDLPTIAGWWSGADIDERSSLGLVTALDAEHAHDERQREKAALVDAMTNAGVAASAGIDAGKPHDAGVTAAVHRYVAASASALVVLQADDLAGEREALNLPGTDRERPNWRRKVSVDASALWSVPAATMAQSFIGEARGAPLAEAENAEGDEPPPA